MQANLRFTAAVVLLVGTALFLRARSQLEIVPKRSEFSSFPRQLGAWQGTDSTIPAESRAVLGPGDFLLRRYQTASVTNPQVDLFLAYFPSQRTGDTIHSPKHCLPGEGWFPIQSSEFSLVVPGRAPIQANRYLISKGDQRALVVYWYQSRDRAVASEYKARFYLIADSIRFNRSDGSLIRVSTLMLPDESTETAEKRLTSLLKEVVPILDRYVPL